MSRNLVQRLVGRLWRLFASVRFALVLILILANLTLIGTLLIQAPSDIVRNSSDYAWWLENVVRPKLGIWTTPLAFLRLFDVFHSFWFLGAGVLLILNIIVCTLNRWKHIKSLVFPKRVKFANEFYNGGVNQASLTFRIPRETAHETAADVLGQRGYRVRVENDTEGVYVAGDKNRLSRLGTFVSHLSIVLFVVAFLLGSYLGFRNTAFMVPEGSTRDVGFGTGVSLHVDSFVDEYWPEGPPKDYRSQVILYDNGNEVKSGLIRVNHPMSYNGIRIYQSFYGSAAVMQVQNTSGEMVYDDGVPLGWVSGDQLQRATGSFEIPNLGLTAYVLAPAQGGYDPMLEPGQVYVELYRDSDMALVNRSILDQGVPVAMEGMEFTFVRERQFSGFQVSRDPGNALIWISSALFVLGLVTVFYFPHRQVWARIHTSPGGVSVVSLRTTSSRSFGVASEFESLTEEMKRRLSSPTTKKSPKAKER